MRTPIALALMAAVLSPAASSRPLVEDRPAGPAAPVRAARVLSMAGKWMIRFDPEDRGAREGWARPAAWRAVEEKRSVPVPMPWEVIPEGAGYDGVAWYAREIAVPAGLPEGAWALLRFEAVNYAATVYVDGTEALRHEGGYEPFRAILPDPRPGKKYFVVLRVVDPGRTPADGMTLAAVPHSKESWYYNYGGITGAVTLELCGPVRVKALFPSFTTPAGMRCGRGNRVTCTVENLARQPLEATLRLVVSDPDRPGRRLVETAIALPGLEGEREVTLPVKPPGGFEAWSPEHPKCYTVEAGVSAAGFLHKRTCTAGARFFDLEEEGFRLNGNLVFIRGVLYQPYYPRTLACPPDRAWVEREVHQMKAAGFNLVRAHVRPPPPAFLEACDRVGLLVMTEPAIGWIREATPEMAERAAREVEALVRACRSHPSVVLYGMLNELSGRVHPLGEALMRRARLLDPTRPVTDDSGGWSGSSFYFRAFEDTLRPYVDLHVYRNYPLDARGRERLRTLGRGKEGPVFVSEFGFGGMADLAAVAKGFANRPFLEDGREYRAVYAEAKRTFQRTPLHRRFRSLEEMEALAGEIQSEAALEIGADLLANPRVAGYCYTQFNDAAWESSAGIVDVLGRRKAAFPALLTLNRLERCKAPPLPPPPRPVKGAPAEPRAATIFPVHLTPPVLDLLRKSFEVGTDLRGEEGAPDLAVAGDPLSLAEEENIPLHLALFRYVKRGGVLLYLRPPRLDRPPRLFDRNGAGVAVDLPVSVHYRKTGGSFLGRFHYVDPLLGLGRGFEPELRFFGRGFGDLLALGSHLPLTDLDRALVPAGTFDCYGLFMGGDVLALPYGGGYFVFSNLRLLNNLEGNPAARRLMENLLAFCTLRLPPRTRRTVAEPPPPSPDACRRIARAARRLRDCFALLEGLAFPRLDGRRRRYRFPPELEAWNALRLQGMEALVAGDYDAGLAAWAAIEKALPPEMGRFMQEEERFFQAAEKLPRRGLTQALVGEAVELHERALKRFAAGDPARALQDLQAARAALPAISEKTRNNQDGPTGR